MKRLYWILLDALTFASSTITYSDTVNENKELYFEWFYAILIQPLVNSFILIPLAVVALINNRVLYGKWKVQLYDVYEC